MAPLVWLVALVFPVESSAFAIFHHLSQPINCKHLHLRHSYDTQHEPVYIPVVSNFFCPRFKKHSRGGGGHFDLYRVSASSSLGRQRYLYPLRRPFTRHHRRRATLRPEIGKQCDCKATKHPPPPYQLNDVSSTDETIPRLLPVRSSSSSSPLQLTGDEMVKRYKGTAQVSKFIDDEIETLSSS